MRPILEKHSPVWNPRLKKDIELLDKVQRQCERLCSQSLTLQPLELRRRKADMRETYKFLHGYYKTDAGTLFSLNTRASRGHSLKLSKEHTRTEIRQQFFWEQSGQCLERAGWGYSTFEFNFHAQCKAPKKPKNTKKDRWDSGKPCLTTNYTMWHPG